MSLERTSKEPRNRKNFVDYISARRGEEKAASTEEKQEVLKPLEYYGIGAPGSEAPGFLYPPSKSKPESNKEWYKLLNDMPHLLRERDGFASALNSDKLPEFIFDESQYSKNDDGTFNADDSNLRSDLQMLAACASAYVNYTDHDKGKSAELRTELGIESKSPIIPKKLAKPLAQLSEMAKVPPILNYAQYVLDNIEGEIPHTEDRDLNANEIFLQDGQYVWERIRFEKEASKVVKRVTVGTYENHESPSNNNAPRTTTETNLYHKALEEQSSAKQYVKSKPKEDSDIVSNVDKISNIGALKLKHPFVGPNEKEENDELGFILIHVGIEAIAAKALYAMPQIIKAAKESDQEKVQKGLRTVAKTYKQMEDIFHLSPAYSRVDNFTNEIRPYITGFTHNVQPDGVIYEGEFDNKPQNFSGGSGAMSSVIPALDELIGFKPPAPLYNTFRDYMPPKHREFLEDLREETKNLDLRKLGGEAFKEAVSAGASLRQAHTNNAIEYLNVGKGDDVVGTGGSMIATFLGGNTRAMWEFVNKPQQEKQSHTR